MKKLLFPFLIFIFQINTCSFAQPTYLTPGKIAIFKADSCISANKNNDSTFSIHENTYASPPLENQKTKGTVRTKVYRLKDQIIQISHSTTHPIKGSGIDTPMENIQSFQIYYRDDKPFYVVYLQSAQIKSETINETRIFFYMDQMETDYLTKIHDYKVFREETWKVIHEIENQ